MTLQDLTTGNPFKIKKGHFERLNRNHLCYRPADNNIIDVITKEIYAVKNLHYSLFYHDKIGGPGVVKPAIRVYHPDYGNITVLLCECHLPEFGPLLNTTKQRTGAKN